MAKKHSDRRQARKERAREAKEAKREAQERAQRRRRLQIRVSAAVAVLTLVIAAICYWVLDNRQLMGIALLIGGVLFLVIALSSLASGVQPRDRTRAGSIDYGNRD
jgi:lipopolysaccharide export LptBFGC system permease protein LptF